MERTLRPARRLSGELSLPGDKSVSHRALILGALSRGTTVIRGLSSCGDVEATLRCLRQLGASVRTGEDGSASVQGEGLAEPEERLDAGNSGTTLRLLLGVLAGRPFQTELTGDASLRRRPMERTASPLRRMGASISLGKGGGAPVRVRGGRLSSIEYELPVPSAQLKSAVLLAGLQAEGTTRILEPVPCRDHTERLIRLFGGSVESEGRGISVKGGQSLRGCEVEVPGDFSCAAYWIAAACLVPGASVSLRDVLLNPSRTGFLDVLRRMGARIRVEEEGARGPEPSGTIFAEHAELRASEVGPDEVPSMIDELPLLALLAARAEGTTVVRGAGELRLKESDRIESTADMLRSLGAAVKTSPDGFAVRGPQTLRGGAVDPSGDHRIVMAASVAGLAAQAPVRVKDAGLARLSYPGFFEDLESLSR